MRIPLCHSERQRRISRFILDTLMYLKLIQRSFTLFRMTVVMLSVSYFLFLISSPAYAFHCPAGDISINCGHCPDTARGKIYKVGEKNIDGNCSTINPGHRQLLECQEGGTLKEVIGGGDADPINCPVTAAPATSNIKTIFGEITPPAELNPFIQKGGAGAGGISLFLNNLITLIYIIASVVFIFMILWSALEWILSGGEKEKISNAQKRLTNAFIGIVLFALAFAIIRTFGIFTGFSFFNTSDTYYWDPNANSGKGACMKSFSPGADNKLITQEVSLTNCPNRP